MTQGPNPQLSAQSFYSFIMFTIMMGASIGSLPDLYASIQKSIGATENLMNIINSPSEKETLKGSEQPIITGEISFEHVEFSYPQRSDIKVLNNISFKANVNDTIALVGTSGSGKSTISSLLLNYYTSTGGSIQFDGTPIEKIDTHYLRSKMAIVPQEVILFGGSIRENIAFGNPEADEAAIIEAAKQANAWEFITSFPEGLETEVGDRGIQLSGGQKQRIAIARAIIADPRVLVLDDATSAVDPSKESEIRDAMRTVMSGRTTIVIAHRPGTIALADRVVFLDGGTIAAIGKHEELVSSNERYREVLASMEHNAEEES